jgi:hypothetical protein
MPYGLGIAEYLADGNALGIETSIAGDNAC